MIEKVSSSKAFKRILIFVFLVIIVGFAIYAVKNKDALIQYFNKLTSATIPAESTNTITDGEFQIHFLELGNEYTGDSTYIKVGDNDILIDAGSRKSSASAIKDYLDDYVTDNKLEYVIATHAHQDHIAGFVGNKDGDSKDGILYQYEIGTIIEFSLTNSTSQIWQDYKTARDYAVSNGAKCYTADDCFNNENGASSTYTLDLGSTMQIMYNKYYFEESDDENNYSVCTLFTHGQKKFLLTGDLEKEGEESMAEYYSTNPGLGHVDLFKAGHHGSATSSNDCLLDIITPDICTVCCCAGATEYTANYNNIFPTQAFINRIAKHTDAVYVTSMFNEKTLEFESLNGNITLKTDGTDLDLSCSNNNTKLKDSNWFNEIIYVNQNDLICSGKGKKDFFTKDDPNTIAKPRRIWPNA